MNGLRRSTVPRPSAWGLFIFASCCVTLAVWASYARVITFGFTGFDTLAHVRQVYELDADTLYRMWLGPLMRGVHYYRPLTMALFALDLQIGGLNATNFNLTHLTIHWANSLCVMLLGIVLARRVVTGLFAGVLFALHPALVVNVANLANRFDLLMTLGTCLTVLFALRAYHARGNARKLAFGLAVASFVLALGAKEPGIIALPLVVAVSILYGQANRSPLGRRARIAAVLKYNAPFIAITVLYLLLHWFATRYDSRPLQYFRNINFALPLQYFEYLLALEPQSASFGASAVILVGAAGALLFFVAWRDVQTRRALLLVFGWFILPIVLYMIAGKALQERFAYTVSVPLVLFCSILLTTVPRLAFPGRAAVLGAQAVLAGLALFWFSTAPLVQLPRAIVDEAATVRAYLEQFDRAAQALPAGTPLELKQVPRRLAYRNNMRYWLEMRWADKQFVLQRTRSVAQENGRVILHSEIGQNPTRIILRAEYQTQTE